MTNFISGLFGKKSSPQAPATQLRVQSSIEGTPRPIGWGQNRLAPNLIYYNDFSAVQVQQQGASGGGKGSGVASGGGKFGGGQAQTNYFCTVICGLCEGPISAIGTAWASGSVTSIAGLNFSFFNGSYSQTAWSYVVAKHPGDARAYRGVAYLAAGPLALGSGPQIPSFNFEVAFGFFEPSGTTRDANPADIVNDFLTNVYYGLNFPASRVSGGDVYLIGDVYGIQNVYAGLNAFWAYSQAAGIWMSPVLTSQKAGNAFVDDVLYGVAAEAVWSGGTLNIVPYYDAAVSGNGASYVPNLSPIYDLTDDDFQPGSNNSHNSPVIVTRKAVSDIYNNVKITYISRAPGPPLFISPTYSPAVVEVQDDASIQTYGLRARGGKQLDLFCYGPSAQQCATLQLGREQDRAHYQFSLPTKYVLLDPMDLVTLTDAALGLSRQLVRIKEITENEDFTLTVTAEDMLLGAASPPLYGAQANSGFVVNTNADPGLTLTPFFMEPTDAFAGGLEVMMAVAPVTLSTWGGCNVYVSYDGVNYLYLGQQQGPSRMGVTTAPFPSVAQATTPPTIDDVNILSVDMSMSGAQLLSATHNDTLAFASLCWLNGEFVAYQNATPTGAHTYNLDSLARAGYQTTPAASSVGTTFVRVDAGVFRIPYTQDRIGQTIYVKLVNINQYGAGPQTLASVSPYTYTIQGLALTSPLPDVQNFTTNYQSNITLFSWDEIRDFRNPIDYEIRRGVDWLTGQVIGRYLHPNVPAIGSSVGGSQYLIKAHCQPVAGLDVYSADAATLTIAGNSAVIPLNIVKSFDEFAVPILSGAFFGNILNNANTIETFGNGDIYSIADVYQLTDVYNFGPAGSGDVYSISDVYTVVDVYGTFTTSTVSGTYTIPLSHIINVGRVAGCLVDCSWTSAGIPVGQNIFTWTDIFSFTDIFASNVTKFVTAFPNINLSQDGSTWVGWQRYRAGFYSAMAFDMQIFVQSVDPNTIGSVSSFSYAVHIPSRIDHYNGVSVPGTAGGLAITFQIDGTVTAAAFNGGPGGVQSLPGLPSWQATIQNEVSGDLVTVTSFTLAGATVKVSNAGSPVARTVNIEFAGY